MMKCNRSLVNIVVSAIFLHAFSLTQAASVSTTPVKRNEKQWLTRHAEKVALAKKGNVDLLYIGDSITQGFELSGKAVWERYYSPRNALNLGFSGDKTENVLWRLDNGEIDGLSPKLAIVLIGTNNTGARNEEPELVANGIKAICNKLRAKLHSSKILLIAIFPRSAKADDPARARNNAANKLIADLADDKVIFFVDINSKFLKADGTLTKEIMPDFLHPREKGYQIWAEAIEPMVAKLMGEKAKK